MDSVPTHLLVKTVEQCIPLHSYFSVAFHRVKVNILNALTFLKNKKSNDSYQIWKELLTTKQNEDIITDGFWLIILKKNKKKFLQDDSEHSIKEYDLIKKTIKDRMAINYVDYIASVAHIIA